MHPIYGAISVFLVQLIASFLMYAELFVIPALFLSFLIPFLLFFMIKTLANRIVYVIAVYLYSPMITMPIESLETKIGEFYSLFTIYDRIGAGLFAKYGLLLALVISLICKKSNFALNKFNIAVLLMIIGSFLGVYKWHVAENFSILHASTDICYYITVFCICVFLGEQSKEENLLLTDSFISTMKLFTIITFVELAITLPNILPWSYSYRNTLRGVLTNSEVVFNLKLGISALFTILYLNRLATKILLALPFFVGIFVYGKNKTSGTAVIGILLLFPLISIIKKKQLFKSAFFKVLLVTVMTFAICLYYYNADPMKQTSMFSRLSTVIAGYVAFSDNYVIGLGPGIVDTSQVTNVAYVMYNYDFRSLLWLLNPEEAASFAERYSYNDPQIGAFNPHILIFLILYSLGLQSLPFIYYYYKLQLKLITAYLLVTDKNKTIVASLLLYMFVFTFLHPVFLPVETVFMLLCLQPFRSVSIDRSERLTYDF